MSWRCWTSRLQPIVLLCTCCTVTEFKCTSNKQGSQHRRRQDILHLLQTMQSYQNGIFQMVSTIHAVLLPAFKIKSLWHVPNKVNATVLNTVIPKQKSTVKYGLHESVVPQYSCYMLYKKVDFNAVSDLKWLQL